MSITKSENDVYYIINKINEISSQIKQKYVNLTEKLKKMENSYTSYEELVNMQRKIKTNVQKAREPLRKQYGPRFRQLEMYYSFLSKFTDILSKVNNNNNNNGREISHKYYIVPIPLSSREDLEKLQNELKDYEDANLVEYKNLSMSNQNINLNNTTKQRTYLHVLISNTVVSFQELLNVYGRIWTILSEKISIQSH